jgi:hypothetical protein
MVYSDRYSGAALRSNAMKFLCIITPLIRDLLYQVGRGRSNRKHGVGRSTGDRMDEHRGSSQDICDDYNSTLVFAFRYLLCERHVSCSKT